MKLSREVLVQIALFVAISIGCAFYLVTNVLDSESLQDPHRVTARMPDSGGISAEAPVTYRGVDVGSVAEVSIDPGGGVDVVLAIDPGARVPADSRAVVSQDTPIALQHVDLRPETDSGPYLRDGSVIEPERTERPLPLEELLTGVTDLGDSVDTRAVNELADSLSTGFNGAGPELTRILDNTASLLRTARESRPALQRAMDNGREFAGPDGERGDRLRALAAGMRSLTDQARTQEPRARQLLGTAPDTTKRVAELMRENEPSVTALLGNLVTTGQVVNVRTPALQHGITTLPDTFGKLGSIVHGDTADFDLVVSQGPVCISPTERRSPTRTEPREPDLNWHCPGDRDHQQQRGAANAPRPTTTYDPATGDTGAGFQLGSSGGQSEVLGPRSWYAIPLQGVR